MKRSINEYDPNRGGAEVAVLPHHQAAALAALNLKTNTLLTGLPVHVLQKITKKANESHK